MSVKEDIERQRQEFQAILDKVLKSQSGCRVNYEERRSGSQAHWKKGASRVPLEAHIVGVIPRYSESGQAQRFHFRLVIVWFDALDRFSSFNTTSEFVITDWKEDDTEIYMSVDRPSGYPFEDRIIFQYFVIGVDDDEIKQRKQVLKDASPEQRAKISEKIKRNVYG